jgi:hypothetical protein
MSASDAAPLPRLGEVFFDVRGDSRSMRLSWYADTGVAVFSIWQGGICTGTFRLPIGDLPRMIEILQRGPRGHRPADAAEHGGGGYAEPAAYAESVGYDDDYDAGHRGDHHRGTAYGAGEHGAGEHGAGEYGAGEHGAGEYGRGAHRTDRHRRSDYGPDDYGPGEYGAGEYGADDHRASEYGPAEPRPGEPRPGERRAGEYGAGEYGRPDYGAGYADGDPGYADGPYRDPGHRAEGYRAADYGPPDYGPPDYEQMPGAPRPARWRDDERYQPDVTGQYLVAADEAGYDQQRFVPPYVRPEAGSSQAGYLDDPEYRLPADPLV